jgi:MFS family permease
MTPAVSHVPFAKLGLLGALYFSQGLPFGFFTQALPVLLREEGVSLDKIGLTSLLALPWALKFAWAPVVDRHGSTRFGRRRSWIVPLQVATIVLLCLLSLGVGTSSLHVLMGAVFLLNLVAATQDIATDGLAVDLLEPAARGLANGLQVAGYRVGMIVGGGALLILHERLGTSGLYLSMAALTALATVPILTTREPEAHPQPGPADGSATTGRGAAHFIRRAGAARVLVLLATYKAGDAFASAMLRPFLVDNGLGLTDIGWLLGTVGFVAGLLGALAGGAAINRTGRRTALVAFGLLQMLSIAGYAFLASRPLHPGLLYGLCAA